MVKNDFIFNLDGVLVDSFVNFHATADSLVLLNECKKSYTPENISKLFPGVSDIQIFKELAPKQNVHTLIKEKWKIMYYLIDRNPLMCIPKMYELVSILGSRELNIAVTSNSPINWVKKCLKVARPSFQPVRYSLSSMFKQDSVFSIDDCKKPNFKAKPNFKSDTDPDPILLKKARYSFEDVKGEKMEVWIKELMGFTFVVTNNREDVRAARSVGFIPLYLSDKNREFDDDIQIKRFRNSVELFDYITKYLI